MKNLLPEPTAKLSMSFSALILQTPLVKKQDLLGLPFDDEKPTVRILTGILWFAFNESGERIIFSAFTTSTSSPQQSRLRRADGASTVDTDVIDLRSLSDDETSKPSESSSSRRCSVGHSYFPKQIGALCPFCTNLLKRYRDFAAGKGGVLVSTDPDDILIFRCHRKDHPEFPLQASSVRSSSSLWCPACNQNSRQIPRVLTDPRAARTVLRESEKRRMETVVEENRRDQAKLLSSAKLLYKITTQSSPSMTFSAPPGLMHDIVEAGKLDHAASPHVSELQCILVRAILACKDRPSESWQIVASALDLPPSTPRDKLFRRAAKLVHPDKCRLPEADEAFKTLNSL